MQITITTRHLIHMLKEAYDHGIREANQPLYLDNPAGRPEIASTEIAWRNLLEYNDAIAQQT